MAAFYVNSNYTDEELTSLNTAAGSTVYFTTLADAQAAAAASTDEEKVIVFEGGTYSEIAKVDGVTYQFDGNIVYTGNAALDLSGSSMIVNVGEGGVDTATAVITAVNNVTVNYGTVTFVGNGETYYAGYVADDDLYVKSGIVYNDSTIAAETEAGATVMVNANGATFAANYGTTVLKGGTVTGSTSYYWSNGSNVLVGSYTAGLTTDNKASNLTKFTNSNLVVTGATITGNFHLAGSITGDAYRLVADSTLKNATLYAAYDCTITGSLTIDVKNVTGNNSFQVFRSGANITQNFSLSVDNSVFYMIAGGGGSATTIGGKVTYDISGSTINGNLNTAMDQKLIEKTSYINGGVEYNIAGSTITGVLTGGLAANDSTATNTNNAKKDSKGNTRYYRIVLDENFDPVFDPDTKALKEVSEQKDLYKQIIYSHFYVGDDVTITVNDSYVASIYGSSNRRLNENVTVSYGDKKDDGTYATTTVTKHGALSYIVDGDITITLTGSTSGTVYGNGQADVNGNVKVILNSSTVTGTLAGSNRAEFSEVSFDETDTVNYNKVTVRAAEITGDVNLTVQGIGNYANTVKDFKTITIDAGATLGVNALTHTGTITINTSDVTGGVRKAIDAAAAQTYGAEQIIVTAEGTTYTIYNGDVIVHSAAAMESVYVYSGWEGYAKGQEITVGGQTVYYGINAFSTMQAAQQVVSENGIVTLVISEDTTINDWSGIDKVILTNGAQITTNNWDSNVELTVDLTGVATDPSNVKASVNYTGSGTISYGTVTLVGSNSIGGWIVDNDLYVGSSVIYNVAGNDAVKEQDSFTIRGTTFTKADGSKFTVYNYWQGGGCPNGSTADTPVTPNSQSYWYLAAKNANSVVVYTSINGQKYTGSHSETNLSGNAVFIDSSFSTTAYHNDGAYDSAGNKTSTGASVALWRDNTNTAEITLDHVTASNTFYVLYGYSKSAASLTLNIVNNSTISNLNTIRSGTTYKGILNINVTDSTAWVKGAASGNFTLGIVNIKYNNAKCSNAIVAGSGTDNSTAGTKEVKQINITIENGSVVGDIYGGHRFYTYVDSKGNNSASEAKITDGITVTVRNSKAANIFASGDYIAEKLSNIQTSNIGTAGVTVNITASTVTNIYAVASATVAGNVTVSIEESQIGNIYAVAPEIEVVVSGNNSTLKQNSATVTGSVAGDITLNVAGVNTVSGEIDRFEYISINADASLMVAGNIGSAEITMGSGSSLSAATLGEGTLITIDNSDLTGLVVINVAGGVAEDTVKFKNEKTENQNIVTADGYIYAYDAAALSEYYVNTAWAGSEAGTVVTTADGKLAVVGINAFASIADTIIKEGNTIYLYGNFDTISAGETANVSFVVNSKVFANSVAAEAVTIARDGALIITGDLTDDLTVTLDNIKSASNKAVFGVTGSVAEGKKFNVNAPEGFSGYTAGNFYFVTTRQANDTYVNSEWTSQADVDASGIKAVWGVNAFAKVANAKNATRTGNTVHLVGGTEADEIHLGGASFVVYDGAKCSQIIFAGNDSENYYGDVKITVNNIGSGENLHRVYGAQRGDDKKNELFWHYGDAELNINSSNLHIVCGSGMGTGTYGDIKINAANSTINELVGGGYENTVHTDVYGNITIDLDNTDIKEQLTFGNFYGSNGKDDKLVVSGDINVTISDAEIKTIYGICRDTKYRAGNTAKSLNLTMTDTTVSDGFYLIGDTHVTGDVVFNATNVTVSAGLDLFDSSKYTVGGDVLIKLDTVTVGRSISANYEVAGDNILELSGVNSVGISVAGFDTININAGATLTAGSVEVGSINVAIADDAAEEFMIIDTTAGITVTGKISGDNEYKVYVFNGDLWASKKLAAAAIGYEADENGFATINGQQVKVFDSLEAAQAALRIGGTIYTKTAIEGVENVENTVVNSNIYAVDGDAANAELTISGSTTGAVLGGASSSGSKVGTDSADGFVGGTINLALTNSNVGTVYGGGYSSVVGDIALTIIDTICNKIVYGGNVTNTGSLTDNTESTIGDVALTINGGEFEDKVVGGSRVVASGSKEFDVTTNVGNVTLNINGGDFADTIFGAGYVLGNNKNTAQLNVAGVTMTLNDMTITNTNTLHGIYAGGLAARGAKIYVGSAAQAQDENATCGVSITVNSGKYTSIYGGGWAESGAKVTVYGVSINVTGGEIANLYGGGNNDQSGARTCVGGNVLITIGGGTIGNVYAGAKFVTSKVKGSSTIQITGNATIDSLCGLTSNGYDSVGGEQILDVDAALSCQSISGFDVIDIASGKDIDIASAFDLGGVELNIAEQTAGWDVLSATELNGLAQALVTLNGQEATWNGSMFASTSYTLTVTENEGKKSLIFGTITA